MESWRMVFRKGIAPQLSRDNLLALKAALESDDKRLLQGTTTMPPAMQCCAEWPVEGCCLLALPGVCDLGGFRNEINPDGSIVLPLREGACTVAEAEEAFARLCTECDRVIGEPAACRWLLNAVDEWSRPEMIANLLPEIDLALQERPQHAPQRTIP